MHQAVAGGYAFKGQLVIKVKDTFGCIVDVFDAIGTERAAGSVVEEQR